MDPEDCLSRLVDLPRPYPVETSPPPRPTRRQAKTRYGVLFATLIALMLPCHLPVAHRCTQGEREKIPLPGSFHGSNSKNQMEEKGWRKRPPLGCSPDSLPPRICPFYEPWCEDKGRKERDLVPPSLVAYRPIVVMIPHLSGLAFLSPEITRIHSPVTTLPPSHQT